MTSYSSFDPKYAFLYSYFGKGKKNDPIIMLILPGIGWIAKVNLNILDELLDEKICKNIKILALIQGV